MTAMTSPVPGPSPADGPVPTVLAPRTPASLVPAAAPAAARAWAAAPALGALGVLVGDATAAAAALPFTSVAARTDLALVLAWVTAQRLTRPTSPLAGACDSARAVLRAAAVLGLVCWVAGTLLHAGSHGSLLAFVAVATAGSLLVRGARVLRRARRPLDTLVVGEPAAAERALLELPELTRGRLEPVGLCTPEDLADRLGHVRPDTVLAVPGGAFTGRAVQRAEWELERAGVPLLVGTGLGGVVPARSTPHRAGELHVVHLSPASRHGARALVKGLWDRSAALVILLLLLVPMLAVGLAVRTTSSGPALFRQTRIGRHGRPFTMLKFRTMTVDAPAAVAALQDRDEGAGVLFKIRSDPRVTPLGRVLRRYSVDELPQLLNVLRGEMSLVGPRPGLPEEVAAYDHDPRRRLAVKPGITGLWQVSGRSDLSWAETVRLDIDYVDNWTLGRDLAILARTVHAVLSHRGAY